MRTARPAVRGISLVELMVATVLALLVVAGVASAYAGLKSSWAAQDELIDMQDAERTAIVGFTQLIRQAGFNPDPLTTPSTAVLPAESNARFGDLAAGQAVMGTVGNGGTADTLTVRFVSDGSHSARSCLGSAPALPGVTVTNRFSVGSSGQLLCQVDAASPQPVLDGVSGLGFLYGVDTDAACAPCEPRQYMNASQVSAAGAWGRVRAVRVVLRFRVPRGQPAWVQWSQAVALMNP